MPIRLKAEARGGEWASKKRHADKSGVWWVGRARGKSKEMPLPNAEDHHTLTLLIGAILTEAAQQEDGEDVRGGGRQWRGVDFVEEEVF